jgi:peptidase C25-like protein
MDTELLVFNGINGVTGKYLIPPMSPETLASIALEEKWDAGHLAELKSRHSQATQPAFRPMEGVDPLKLEQTGWGVIFPAALPGTVLGALREALSELLDLRQKQAGELYREYSSAAGFRHGDSKDDFLSRHGAGPGPVDPRRVPYYLLLVGDPESIPYRFQYELDVQYAVGRIHFDKLDEYAQYAHSVVEAETPGKIALPRRAVFFGVQNPDDKATHLSAEYLIKPLAEEVKNDQATWQVETLLKGNTTRDWLLRLLGGPETPALLFTTSHGIGFPNGHTLQLPHQGALLCQDWPGTSVDFSRDQYLAAEDITDDARLLGLMSFHFACYGAGTPYWDDFAEQAFTNRSTIAPHAFIAALPRRLLSHPKGGALAVVGHVERAWTYSFQWNNTQEQTVVFQSMLKRLMEGHPIGSAVEDLNTRYAEISTLLSNEVEESKWTKPDVYKLANLWTANKDARGYAVLGDPAVRLPVVASDAIAVERPVTEPVRHRDTDIPPLLAPDPALRPQRASVQPVLADTGPASIVPEGAVAMGLPSVAAIRDTLGKALGQLAEQLAAFMRDVTTLEVATYVSDRMQEVRYDPGTGNFSTEAQQRALTSIRFDGDTKICVPTDAGQVDAALWAIHTGMVQQAQANRTAMLKMAADMLAGLLNFAKPG